MMDWELVANTVGKSYADDNQEAASRTGLPCPAC